MEPWLDTALTWLGAVGGVLGGVSGIVGACVAAKSARQAKREAEASKEQVEQSTALLAEAVDTADTTRLVAVDARDLAIQSNELSEKSNAIATEAKSLAEDATEIARRTEQRATEVHDVDWVYDMPSQGILAFQNDGRHTAFDVHLVVYVDEEKAVGDAAQVPAGGVIELEFPKLKAAVQQLVRDEVQKRVQRRRAEQDPFRYLVNPVIPSSMEGMFRVDWRVQWVTEERVPKTQSDNNFAYLGDLQPYEDAIDALVDRAFE